MSFAEDFTEEDVLEELRELGYDNVPRDKLSEFMTDLKHLMEEREEKSRHDTDISFADSSTDISYASDGLARYPHHTDFHWGRPKPRKSRDVDTSAQSSPSAFEISKAPLHRDSLSKSQHRSQDIEESMVSPQRGCAQDVSVASSASTSSIIVKRKISRRDRDGNRDISTEELTYVDENDDDAATLVDEDHLLHDDNNCGAPDLVRPRIVGRRHSQSESSDDSRMSSALTARPSTALPSFIRPRPEIRKRYHDPVRRYHQYNEAWMSQRAPGEKQHKQLRWAVREQMQRREEIITPAQRHYVPNDFVPPTEKKRQDLRWEIRTKMAH